MLDHNWFTEVCEECGSAYSLQIKKKLHEEQTPYQNITIYETVRFGTLMVIDGFIMLADLDNFIYHEMLSHPALFIHSNPKNVLIIGGGDCGTLLEVLKHPQVTKVQQVEIDQRVTQLAEKYFPDLCKSNNDPRVEFIFTDGIQWVKDAIPAGYDVIIIDSTDPIGPAEGLFKESFYGDCLSILDPGGIIVQQSESPLIHLDIIKAMRQAMGNAGYEDIKTINFPQPVYPSGWWSATLASKGQELIKFPRDRIINKPFKTRYYNHETHMAALATPSFLAEELGQ